MYNINMLKENERLDDLECKSLFIIQKENGYRFTSDSVILANSTRVTAGDRVVDLGTGSGVIAILLAGKTKAKEIIGVEIQESLADMASRSVEYNGLSDRVRIVNVPMQKADKVIGGGFDVVVTNPPYGRPLKTEGITEEDICKREYAVSLEEVVETADKLLKYGGLFYMINKASRLAEMTYYMKKRNLEPKKLLLIQPKADKDVDTVIIEAKKGAKPSLVVPKPFVVYESDGSFTEEARRMYGK